MANRTTIDITDDHVESLTSEVSRLREEVQVLRDVLAELVEDVQWAIRNGIVPSETPSTHFRLKSMPVDPCADDFHERVNAIQPNDITTEPRSQQMLWSDDS